MTSTGSPSWRQDNEYAPGRTAWTAGVVGMTDAETSSDTLRERLRGIGYSGAANQAAHYRDVAEDAIEYVARMESRIDALEQLHGEPDPKDLIAYIGRDPDTVLESTLKMFALAAEADATAKVSARDCLLVVEHVADLRAERDQLHDALKRHAVRSMRARVGPFCYLCETPNVSERGHAEDCLLRVVERGDTVTRIRRESERRGAEKVYEAMETKPVWDVDDVLGDDQEGDDGE